ncbi:MULTISPECIES: DNA polymerase III subunit delta [unclassified Adlercreutzia]|uniref:DNA polymerase III subunit delta n=1 Tax=unclassified Adlercreutzia TaxID=2636013 RepID=UPI0013EC7736|nr:MULTISPECIES: DNA polymerase III subunit delta [unclassified Adlercreutzia]
MTTRKDTELLPAYLVVGEDALKRAAVLARLRTRMEAYGDLSFNSEDLNGETATGADVTTACNTMPFASEKRLVYVRNAEKLKKADSEAVVAYLKAPSPTTVLLLEAEKLAKNTRLYKAVAAVGKSAVIDCAPPKRYELPRQVRAMATAHGVTFTEGAATKLVELVGENTVHLDNEIRKIALAHRGRDAVNENEVISLVARTAEVKPWELVDAFAARDLKKCLRYLQMMESASPHALIALCVNRTRELLCAQSLMRRGSVAQLPSALGMPDWRCKHHATWARQFTASELRRAICSARDAERAMKSGADADAAFRDWLVATLRR